MIYDLREKIISLAPILTKIEAREPELFGSITINEWEVAFNELINSKYLLTKEGLLSLSIMINFGFDLYEHNNKWDKIDKLADWVLQKFPNYYKKTSLSAVIFYEKSLVKMMTVDVSTALEYYLQHTKPLFHNKHTKYNAFVYGSLLAQKAKIKFFNSIENPPQEIIQFTSQMYHLRFHNKPLPIVLQRDISQVNIEWKDIEKYLMVFPFLNQ